MAEDKSYIGVGKVHVRQFGVQAALRFVGNVSAFTLKHNLNILKQPDYTRLGGGTAKQVERIDSVVADMTWLSFVPENFALATAGTTNEVTGTTVTAESAWAYKDSFVPLAHPPSAITTVTSDPTGTTYVAGDDYELSPGGLYIPAGSAIPDATTAGNILVTYQSATYDKVEAAVRTSTQLYLTIEGLNEADSGKPVLIDCWKLSMPPAAQISLIGNTFGELAVSAELLKDSTRGAGLSALYRTRFVQ